MNKKREKMSAFTLVELMVVVVIVALLAALLVPMLTARIEAARWSEGKSGAGTIATSLRAYVIEKTELEPGDASEITSIDEFMVQEDLNGKYFQYTDYSLSGVSYDPTDSDGDGYIVEYTIQVNAGTMNSDVTWKKQGYTLDHTGTWLEVGSGE